MMTADSQATYCSEVEELTKLTSENSQTLCSKLPPERRSQRLSLKPKNDGLVSWEDISTSRKCKVYKKSRNKRKLPYSKPSLNHNGTTNTQEIFSTQDIREAQDSTTTALTCNQRNINVQNYENNEEPLNLSLKFEGLAKEFYPSQEIQQPVFTGINCNQPSTVALSKIISQTPQKEDVNLDLSIKSKIFAQESCVKDLKEDVFLCEKQQNTSFKSLNETVQQLPYVVDNADLASCKLTNLKDIQQNELITNLAHDAKILKNTEISQNAIDASVVATESRTQDNPDKHLSNIQNDLILAETKENLNIPQLEKQKLSGKNGARGRPRKSSTTANKTPAKRRKKFHEIQSTNLLVLPPINNLNCVPNTPVTTQDSLNKSILPDSYPPHFKYQLPPEAVLTRPIFSQPTVMTPDNTPSCELQDSTSSSPSLPESLRGVFDSDDIREILNIEKVAYRLYNYHIRALAAVLNLRVEYLCDILDKIVRINSNVLRNVDKAIKMPFIEDHDLFAATPEESPTSNGDVVPNSQSPNNQRCLTFTKEKLKENIFKFSN